MRQAQAGGQRQRKGVHVSCTCILWWGRQEGRCHVLHAWWEVCRPPISPGPAAESGTGIKQALSPAPPVALSQRSVDFIHATRWYTASSSGLRASLAAWRRRCSSRWVRSVQLAQAPAASTGCRLAATLNSWWARSALWCTTAGRLRKAGRQEAGRQQRQAQEGSAVGRLTGQQAIPDQARMHARQPSSTAAQRCFCQHSFCQHPTHLRPGCCAPGLPPGCS